MSLKKLLKPIIIPASMNDYPIIEKMWPFYIYDMGRYCGFNQGWEDPTDLSFNADDLTIYFNDPNRKAFLIKVDDHYAGFVLLNKFGHLPDTQWSVAEFFVTAKFQGKGVGRQVAEKIWEACPGLWEVTVIPENKAGLDFWRKLISTTTQGHYLEETQSVDCRGHEATRCLFSFSAG